MVILVIISMLTTLAPPGLDRPAARSEPYRFTQVVRAALAQARSMAVGSNERITLCGSQDGKLCSRQWSDRVELLVFTDRDHDRQLGAGDVLHHRLPLRLRHGNATWRFSLGRPWMRYRVSGSAVEYGRISYCPHNGAATEFRQLVINRAGRVYQHHDGTGRREHCYQVTKE